MRLPADDWVLIGEIWTTGDVLYLVKPGTGYTASACWDDAHHFIHWKINLEEPMRRTSLGFDYMDQTLDIIVSGDRSTWHWKDEDELLHAQTLGIFTADQVKELYQRGEGVVQSMQANEPPFDGGWETWQPNPAWRGPLEVPPGWKLV